MNHNLSDGKKGITLKKFIKKYSCAIILVIFIIISSSISDVFLTSQNIFNLLRQSTPLLVMSLGMLLVILTGGIDLSTGAIMGVANMMVSVLLINCFGTPGGLVIAVVLTLLAGAAFGMVSGLLVTVGRVAPFIVTLAVMLIARGCAYLITNGQPVRLPANLESVKILTAFGNKSIQGINLPWPVLVSILAGAVLYLVMNYTAFGRTIIATGSNENAVLLAGIAASRYKLSAYCICGMLSAMAGIVLTARAGTGTPITGQNFELDAIASCVIGGASLSGGKGTVGNTILGVMVLMLITNIMNLLSVPAYPQQIIKGCIIIIAVLGQQQRGSGDII